LKKKILEPLYKLKPSVGFASKAPRSSFNKKPVPKRHRKTLSLIESENCGDIIHNEVKVILISFQ